MDEIVRAAGQPYDVGVQLGTAWRGDLAVWIDRYLAAWPARDGLLEPDVLTSTAASWLLNLPARFRIELEGVAAGSGVPLERIASMYAAERASVARCSSVVWTIGDHAWVARNNDVWAPELWGGATSHAATGRIPRLGFGVQADTMTTTGLNAERLWLHYNHGPAGDAPDGTRPVWDAFVFVSEALETCASVADVECLLSRVDRFGGMLLFAVDGLTGEQTLFECTSTRHTRRDPIDGVLIGCNHFCRARPRADDGEREVDNVSCGSRVRHRRLEQCIAEAEQQAAVDPVKTLRAILADDGVEQRSPDRTTVFSVIACPATGVLWFASGTGPAASTGHWREIVW